MTTTSLSEAEFQRATSAFVQREVICCVSALVAALIEWSPDEKFYDFFETFLRVDEDDNPIEVYEYWFVTDALAAELSAKGEMIACDFFGHNVWGRTCTGQSICLDHVIRDIYSEVYR